MGGRCGNQVWKLEEGKQLCYDHFTYSFFQVFHVGSLRIKLEENLKDTTSDAEKAPLSNTKLRFLTLWLYKTSQDLEALQPHQHLEVLSIAGYGSTRVPSWMISLQNLRYLCLEGWGECECLPPLGKLPFLEEIAIGAMKKVKTVGDEFLGIMDTQTSASSSSVFFPKLKDLIILDMAEWEQWEGVGGDELTIMPCLDSLGIARCPKLMNLPLFLRDTPVKEVYINGSRRSIVMPVWPDNCDIHISFL